MRETTEYHVYSEEMRMPRNVPEANAVFTR